MVGVTTIDHRFVPCQLMCLYCSLVSGKGSNGLMHKSNITRPVTCNAAAIISNDEYIPEVP